MEALTELRKHVQSSKFVIGTSEVMKLLKHNKLARIFAASNCPASIKDGLKHYGAMADCEIVELEIPNDELGVMCKKPFSISVAGVLR
ncbi:ribosomal L7Ae/L30e/S12e/Gadd45 family protein [Candidatus Woesearchaeota archaeon]|nr:ribosomal L7Ae/L30e/S12e/Gadd45 family protein [Candidatus Woesearchaeota archaeon]